MNMAQSRPLIVRDLSADNAPTAMASLAKSIGVTTSQPGSRIVQDPASGSLLVVNDMSPDHATPVALPLSVTANTVTRATNRAVSNFRALRDILKQKPMIGIGIAIGLAVGALLVIRFVLRARRKCNSNADCTKAMMGRHTCFRGKCESSTQPESKLSQSVFEALGLRGNTSEAVVVEKPQEIVHTVVPHVETPVTVVPADAGIGASIAAGINAGINNSIQAGINAGATAQPPIVATTVVTSPPPMLSRVGALTDPHTAALVAPAVVAPPATVRLPVETVVTPAATVVTPATTVVTPVAEDTTGFGFFNNFFK